MHGVFLVLSVYGSEGLVSPLLSRGKRGKAFFGAICLEFLCLYEGGGGKGRLRSVRFLIGIDALMGIGWAICV